MKKLILFLLLSFASIQGQTRSDIQTQIDAISDGNRTKAVVVRTVLNSIANGTAQTGDVKEIDVNNAYITANFDPSGLGINERVGWAICNGNNGTRNRSGRIGLQYDVTNYPTLGATGGEKTHAITRDELPANVIIPKKVTDGTSSDSGGLSCNFDLNTNEALGSGTPINLMQPYIVTLYIMKL